MIRLHRTHVKVLATWSTHVQKAFPDLKAFLDRAEAFEDLDIDDPVRRAGFKSFAPEVFPPKGKKGDCEFKPIWGKAKKAIAAMSHRKCAYCETPINAERAAAVEHFRPKSLFPSLVYDWANYFLGCGGCNGAKSDRWPAEGTCYVRPDEGNPEALFLYKVDGRVEPADIGGPADFTIKDWDLNREWLTRLRALTIQAVLADLTALLDEVEIPEDTQERLVQKMLARLQNPELAYSAAVKQNLVRAWSARLPER